MCLDSDLKMRYNSLDWKQWYAQSRYCCCVLGRLNCSCTPPAGDTWCYHFFRTLSSPFQQLLVNSSLEALSSNHLSVISNAVLLSPEPKTAVIGRRILGCRQLRLQPRGFISGERTRSFWEHYLFILYSDADPVCPPTRPGVATCRHENTLRFLPLLIRSHRLLCSVGWVKLHCSFTKTFAGTYFTLEL